MPPEQPFRFFDPHHNRLIYANENATPEFWDKHWSVSDGTQTELTNTKHTWVSEITQNYLKPEDGPILEGGCGKAIHLAALVHNSFQCIGIDYAIATVEALNRLAPELDIRLGDVRELNFEDAHFAGYWSMGVIEHFWDGYEPIGLEMARVIRPGGYLFLSFPYMSPLRRLKAKLKRYPVWDKSHPPEDFYQFALDQRQVITNFERLGFKLMGSEPKVGLKGATEEIKLFGSWLEYFSNYGGRSIFIRAIRWLLYRSLSRTSAHTILLIFKRV